MADLVTRESTLSFLGCAFRNIDLPPLSEADVADITDALRTAISQHTGLVAENEGVTITREVYDFLMGQGSLEGVWFNDLHKGLPGRFWWRGVLRSAAVWPDDCASLEADV